MGRILNEICVAIGRNPKIKRVIVSRHEYDTICHEADQLRFRWLRPKAEKVTDVVVMNRPVLCRDNLAAS